MLKFLILLLCIYGEVGFSAEVPPVSTVKVTGGDELYTADVLLNAGIKRMATDAVVTVEEIFGLDNIADTWFRITACPNGSSLTVSIAAGASGGAVSEAVSFVAPTNGVLLTCADQVITELNANSTFNSAFRASRVKDNAIIHITSKFYGEYGERSISGDFAVVFSGGATGTVYWDNIIRRRKTTSLSRDPNDKRIGVLGISGDVQQTPGALGDLYVEKFLNGASPNMIVNGSVTPVVFSIAADTEHDIYINEIRFYGNANGIKFGQFLGQNTVLTNGLLIEIKSDNEPTSLPTIKSTDDFKHVFALGDAQGFQLHIQSGRDDFLASLRFTSPFVIRKSGTFTVNDYAKITVRDNLTSGVLLLEALAFGFEKLP